MPANTAGERPFLAARWARRSSRSSRDSWRARGVWASATLAPPSTGLYWGPRAPPVTDDFPGAGTGREGDAGAAAAAAGSRAGAGVARGAAWAVTTVPQEPQVNFCPASNAETSNFARHLGQS